MGGAKRDMSMLLDVKNLTVAYAGIKAVDGVSFSIAKGEIFALVGESGSGKSSIGLALTRLLPMPPAAITGQVILDGRDILASSEEEVRKARGGKIGYVFQEPASALNPVLTIGEQLSESIRLHAPDSDVRKRSVEWLKRVGIEAGESRLSAYPHEFSGGMQQRVCLAMALAAHPALLVADEPTTALDVTVQVQILRLIRDLQRQLDLSVLLISHDLLIVERIAHRVGVLSQGRLVELGKVSDVFQKPQHATTQALLRSRLLLGNPHG